MSSRILQVCFKCLRIANFIEKSNKNFYWTSSKISNGRPLESTECPVELLYWTSPRAEDLADFIYLTYLIIILQVSQRPSFWSFFFWSPIILWQHLIFFKPIFYEMTTTNFRASSSLSFHSKEDFCSFLSDSFSRSGGGSRFQADTHESSRVLFLPFSC